MKKQHQCWLSIKATDIADIGHVEHERVYVYSHEARGDEPSSGPHLTAVLVCETSTVLAASGWTASIPPGLCP